MDALSDLNVSEPLLIICDKDDTVKYTEKAKQFQALVVFTLESLKDLEANTFSNVGVFLGAESLTSAVLSQVLSVLKPEGKLIITNLDDASKTEFTLKTTGFMNVAVNETSIIATKPKFAVGSSAKLSLKKPAVWKLEDDGDDLIDPDDLLDEDDLKKPDPTSLKVCGTTGKRKACKDCSCGLAEELASEAQNGKVIDTTDAPKSSCGSCYLGDAFRCAACPYLGMPAFKPGEKIQLNTAQLKSDI